MFVSVIVGVPGHPVVYVIHSVGMRHGSQVGHGAESSGLYVVLVVGQHCGNDNDS